MSRRVEFVGLLCVFFFFKQKTAYEIVSGDWSSDVCSSDLDIPIAGTTFFLGRETLVASDRPGMAQWRESLFAFMSRNALRATAFFKIPADQVFEVGAQVEL